MTFEQFICELVVHGSKRKKLPICWHGTFNAIHLYCTHPHYSPFLPAGDYCSEEEKRKNIEALINRPPPHIEFTNEKGVRKVICKNCFMAAPNGTLHDSFGSWGVNIDSSKHTFERCMICGLPE